MEDVRNVPHCFRERGIPLDLLVRILPKTTSSTHLEVLAVDPADDLDLIWSPCLMSAPFGEMENERRRYIMASTSP